MSKSDIWALVYSYLYAFGLLGLIEWTGKKLHWPQWVTRKLVHIGAGMWVWGILFFFDNWYIGIIPFATFIILNFIFYRYRIFKTMDKEDSSPGTVYFAVSITLLFLVFWRTNAEIDQVPIAIAAVMAMTWGDAAASLVGKSIGKRKFSYLKNNRTIEGSSVMFAVSFIVIALTIFCLPGSFLSPMSAGMIVNLKYGLGVSALAAFMAALAEGLSPAGTDNLSVPLLTAGLLWILL